MIQYLNKYILQNIISYCITNLHNLIALNTTIFKTVSSDTVSIIYIIKNAFQKDKPFYYQLLQLSPEYKYISLITLYKAYRYINIGRHKNIYAYIHNIVAPNITTCNNYTTKSIKHIKNVYKSDTIWKLLHGDFIQFTKDSYLHSYVYNAITDEFLNTETTTDDQHLINLSDILKYFPLYYSILHSQQSNVSYVHTQYNNMISAKLSLNRQIPLVGYLHTSFYINLTPYIPEIKSNLTSFVKMILNCKSSLNTNDFNEAERLLYRYNYKQLCMSYIDINKNRLYILFILCKKYDNITQICDIEKHCYNSLTYVSFISNYFNKSTVHVNSYTTHKLSNNFWLFVMPQMYGKNLIIIEI